MPRAGDRVLPAGRVALRYVVVGAGILGLASARTILASDPEADVLVLDKEPEPAQHQTGHNSGVVHAGLYYTPGSLKARLCRRGVGLLRDYCADNGIAYDECGKVLVATNAEELGRLDGIAERAAANGVPGIRRLTASELREIEPHAAGIGGLHSPTTAIVDFAAVARRFAADVEQGGGELRVRSEVVAVRDEGDYAEVRLEDETTERADRVLVCPGLQADRLARASGRAADPRIIPFRGEYYALRPERTSLVRGLIYPVPDPSLPFLGVHLTRTIGGGVLVGPNAVLGLRDLPSAMGWRGMRRVARRYWRVGAAELARSASKRAFVHAAKRYVPALRADDVVAAGVGVRAQAVSAAGALVDDFVLDGERHVMWVRNAPSPGATSSMAIAEELVERLANPSLSG